MITVFTPTYNRANKLELLFASLVKQSNTSFEWLVIDDGSSDGTPQLMTRLSEEACFPVRYYRQPNGGKHRAYNRALTLAAGDWFLCLDSDDRLSDDAVEILASFLQSCKRQIIVAYKQDADGRVLSDPFPADISNSSLYDLEFKFRRSGEYTLVFETVFARRFLFPVFEGETFMTEAVIYDRMLKSEAALLPMAITLCEYQQDGLTSNLDRLMRRDPAGFCLYFMQRIDLPESVFDRFITAGKYHAFCFFAGKNKTPYTGKHRILVVLAKPLGVAFRYYYKFFRGF